MSKVMTLDLREAAHDHLLMHYTRNGAFGPGRQELVVLERGEGPYVFDTEGNRYFDALSALFCSQLGYSYGEELASAAAAQMARLPFATTWGFAHPAAVQLAERLAQLAPSGLDHVFFTSGGAESVESAWKIARLYHVDASTVRIYLLPALRAIKISFPRPTAQGGVHDRDLHAGQQHVPLLSLHLLSDSP